MNHSNKSDCFSLNFNHLITPGPCFKCLPVQAVLDDSSSSTNEYYRPLAMDLNSRIPVPFKSLVGFEFYLNDVE